MEIPAELRTLVEAVAKLAADKFAAEMSTFRFDRPNFSAISEPILQALSSRVRQHIFVACEEQFREAVKVETRQRVLEVFDRFIAADSKS